MKARGGGGGVIRVRGYEIVLRAYESKVVFNLLKFR